MLMFVFLQILYLNHQAVYLGSLLSICLHLECLLCQQSHEANFVWKPCAFSSPQKPSYNSTVPVSLPFFPSPPSFFWLESLLALVLFFPWCSEKGRREILYFTRVLENVPWLWIQICPSLGASWTGISAQNQFWKNPFYLHACKQDTRDECETSLAAGVTGCEQCRADVGVVMVFIVFVWIFFSHTLGESHWQFLMPWKVLERKSSICFTLNLCKHALQAWNECVLNAGGASDCWLKYVTYMWRPQELCWHRQAAAWASYIADRSYKVLPDKCIETVLMSQARK